MNFCLSLQKLLLAVHEYKLLNLPLVWLSFGWCSVLLRSVNLWVISMAMCYFSATSPWLSLFSFNFSNPLLPFIGVYSNIAPLSHTIFSQPSYCCSVLHPKYFWFLFRLPAINKPGLADNKVPQRNL